MNISSRTPLDVARTRIASVPSAVPETVGAATTARISPLPPKTWLTGRRLQVEPGVPGWFRRRGTTLRRHAL